MVRFILIRHGETEWNRVEQFRGRADIPLNETGLAQARATGARVASEWSLAAIYSSPLSRALRTAEAIAAHFQLPVQAVHGLVDIDYGEWQGLTPDEVRERWPGILDAWYDAPQSTQIPSGETLDVLRTRAMTAVREIAGGHGGETVAVVAHTVVNRSILLGILGLSNERFWQLRQDPCGINVFEADGRAFTLVSMNDTCHLCSSQPTLP